MRRLSWLLCVCFVLPGSSAFSQSPAAGEVPRVLVLGFDAYKMGGPDEAMRTWLRGSPNEGNHDVISQASVLRSVQETYGAYRGYQVISTRELTSSARILYMTIDYERGPVFAKFVLYRAELGWIVTDLAFNTSDTAILPTQ
ncbi:MAG: hypothetical protein WA414_05325 [Acidobacteriaceae bacterium]|jgi:hypothetical protein